MARVRLEEEPKRDWTMIQDGACFVVRMPKIRPEIDVAVQIDFATNAIVRGERT